MYNIKTPDQLMLRLTFRIYVQRLNLLLTTFPKNAFAMQYSHANLSHACYALATSSPPALAVSISTIPCTIHALWLAFTTTFTLSVSESIS